MNNSCEQCGTELRDGARFCRVCGAASTPSQSASQAPSTPGATICRSCGQANPADSRFCLECGAPLQFAPSPAVPALQPLQPQPPQQQPQPAPQPQPPQPTIDPAASGEPQNLGDSRRLFVLASVVVGVIVVGIVAAVLLIHSSHKQTTLASGTSTTSSTSTSTTAQSTMTGAAALNTAAGRSQFNATATAQLHEPVMTSSTAVFTATVPTATKQKTDSDSYGWIARDWVSRSYSNFYILDVSASSAENGTLSQTISENQKVLKGFAHIVSTGNISTPYHRSAYRSIYTMGGSSFEELYFQQCGQVLMVSVNSLTNRWKSLDPMFQMFLNSVQVKCR